MARVHMNSRKWPNRRHWQYDLDRLGQDEHGVWLHAAHDTIAQRGSEQPRKLESGFVALIPQGTWWTAEFYWSHPWHAIYVNIGTPSVWDGDTVSLIDLDLDVVRLLDGRVEVLDEDEFLDHQVVFSYPQKLIDDAVATTAHIVDMLQRKAEPFSAASVRWIDQVIGS